MGNFSSSDNKTGISYTASGMHTSPKIIPKSPEKVRTKYVSFDSKIFKDIFPEKAKNGISPQISKKSTISEDDEQEIPAPKNSLENELNTINNKSADDIRRNYIARLIFHNVWQPGLDKKLHNSLIIFDWDDTILPTSHLTHNGYFSEDKIFSEADILRVKILEESVLKLMNMAIKSGDTYIITNAAPGWVEYSSQRFYPEVFKLLKSVNIISARGQFEKLIPGNSRQWKIEAYLNMINTLDVNLVMNIICLGDSIIEMEAAHILASKFCHAYIKTIKFRESPKPEELGKQLVLVIDQFNKISGSVKNLTIRVDKKQKENKV
jgi:hypothetical protein